MSSAFKALRAFTEAKTLSRKVGALASLEKRCASKSSFANRVSEDEIKKSVFISQSKDVYTNLALEDWLYRNFDFNKHHVMLLWQNDPCVVIGRHQNPWLECNVPEIQDRSRVALARRNSGGGTVYHDNGNLNLTFFAPRERYNRAYNLGIVKRAMFRQYGLKTSINQKEDIIVQEEFKISGTASKLGHTNTYHHCTLLVNTNIKSLHKALTKTETGMSTNATESIPSPIKNLQEVNSHVRFDELLNALGWEYLRTKAFTLEDGGEKLIHLQNGFQMLNPTEDWFPGITKIRDELKSWNWIFGKSPKFTVTRLLDNSSNHNRLMKFLIEVENGKIQDTKIAEPSSQDNASVDLGLQGSCYTHDLTEDVLKATLKKKIHQLTSMRK